MITRLRIAEMSQRQGEGGYVLRMGVIEKRKKSRGGGGGRGQGRCERRSEAFVKIQKKKKNFGGCVWGGGGGGQVAG